MTGEDTATDGTVEETPAAPVLRVVNPDATPEEIAALVAVFSAIGGGAAAPEPARSEWAAPARGVRLPRGAGIASGRGAWRASGLPR